MAQAFRGAKMGGKVQAIVDGVNVIGLDKYRIQSPLFNFTLGGNNILGLPAQTTTF
jgi:hypothetical protein